MGRWATLVAAAGIALAAHAECSRGAPELDQFASGSGRTLQQATSQLLYTQGEPVKPDQPGWEPWPYHAWGAWTPTVVST